MIIKMIVLLFHGSVASVVHFPGASNSPFSLKKNDEKLILARVLKKESKTPKSSRAGLFETLGRYIRLSDALDGFFSLSGTLLQTK